MKARCPFLFPAGGLAKGEERVEKGHGATASPERTLAAAGNPYYPAAATLFILQGMGVVARDTPGRQKPTSAKSSIKRSREGKLK